MAVTEKVSVAMGGVELRLAKTAAKQEGISLSAFVTGAVRDRLEQRRRVEAAHEVIATFDAGDLPTPDEQRELVTIWSAPRDTPLRRRSTRRASAGETKRR